VEAAATISACITASRAEATANWAASAFRAFDWFLGDNDVHTTLINLRTGACCDGLHIDRRNENTGAESTLSYLLGLAELRKFARTNAKKSYNLDAQLIRNASRAGLDRPAQMPNNTHISGQLDREAV